MPQFQPIMKIRATAVLPLSQLGSDGLIEGAKVNREMVLALNKLGYQDVEVTVAVHQRRRDPAGKPIGGPGKGEGKAPTAEPG